MVTAKDIQEKAFERAGKGYNMSQVDEFLDELAADFTSLSKENAALKGKLKVLVQKVDEYRQTEDSMRLALLSAQKLSAQIESDARVRADAMLAEAQDRTDKLTRQAADGIANEEAKLEEAKKATNRFFDHMRTVCQKQIEFYDRVRPGPPSLWIWKRPCAASPPPRRRPPWTSRSPSRRKRRPRRSPPRKRRSPPACFPPEAAASGARRESAALTISASTTTSDRRISQGGAKSSALANYI